MNSEQIKKLAAAGLTVEQIAVVAEMMEPVRSPVHLSDLPPDVRRAILDDFIKTEKERTPRKPDEFERLRALYESGARI